MISESPFRSLVQGLMSIVTTLLDVVFTNDVYYEINPKNKDEYRTIHVRLNPFTQHPQGIRSNYINGIPPEHLKPIPPALNRRINSIPPTIPF